MRTSRLFAAFACGAALAFAVTASSRAIGTADILPKPSERQQQAIDVLAKLNSLLVPTREQFLAGSISFIVYHELGHFLIDEYKIPNYTGREEDMADAYATFELAPYTSKEQMQSSVRLWLYHAVKRGIKPVAWWDEHSLDQQRAFQAACFLYGRWPEKYAGLPEAFGAPDDRIGMCTEDSELTQTAWVQTLRAQGAVILSKQSATVTYMPSPPELRAAERWLRSSGLLESIAAEIQRYQLPDWRIQKQIRIQQDWEQGRYQPSDYDRTRDFVEVTGESCGQANAFYVPAPQPTGGVFSIKPLTGQPLRPKLIVCYELVDELLTVASQGLPATTPGP